MDIELFDEYHEFSDDAAIKNYNVAFKQKAFTLDAGKLGQEVV